MKHKARERRANGENRRRRKLNNVATEVELKLTGPPRALTAASRLPWLRRIACGQFKKEKLVSVYFDTPKCKLREHGSSLRIRKKGRKRLQTIKAQTDAATGAFSRNEWEEGIGSDAPDLKLAKDTPLESLLGKKSKDSLRPLFETTVERICVPVRVGTSEIGFAIDRGWIRAGSQRERIGEIELELRNGDAADLAKLAERLADALPVSYGALAKAERGYALGNDERGKPVEASDIRLDPAASAGTAFTMIGLSCLHHVAANEDAVRRAESEGVHQMRVGLRRLRAAISVFKEMIEGRETEDLKAELKWLTDQLGPARDFDVLVEESLAPLGNSQPAKPEIKVLTSNMEDRRDKGFEIAKAAVESARYRRLVLRTALWLACGVWLESNDSLTRAQRDRPVREFAREILSQRAKKIVKKSKKVQELDARSRHKLRIAVKKLRYSTDFFASLFGKPKAKAARKPFRKALKALQEALGKINDIAVHDKLAREFVQPDKPSKKRPQEAYAMGLLTGREQKKAHACIAAAKKAGKALSTAEPFWK